MVNVTPTSGSSTILTNKYVHYNDLPTSWTEYSLDVSNITGTQVLTFIGGYTDSTGATSSNTKYSNIRLYGINII